MERSLRSRVFLIYPFPISIILVHIIFVLLGEQKQIRIHDNARRGLSPPSKPGEGYIRDPKEEFPKCGSDHDEVNQVITGSFKLMLEARRIPVLSYGQNRGG